MPNPTRPEQIAHLLRLLEDCPTACRVTFCNPAMPAGVVVYIPPAPPEDDVLSERTVPKPGDTVPV
jgi:hypothetical protein